jgi:hypothetical protein
VENPGLREPGSWWRLGFGKTSGTTQWSEFLNGICGREGDSIRPRAHPANSSSAEINSECPL